MGSYKNKNTGKVFSADDVEIVKCPCCKNDLLVGVSEWLTGVRRAEDYTEMTRQEADKTKGEEYEFNNEFIEQ